MYIGQVSPVRWCAAATPGGAWVVYCTSAYIHQAIIHDFLSLYAIMFHNSFASDPPWEPSWEPPWEYPPL